MPGQGGSLEGSRLEVDSLHIVTEWQCIQTGKDRTVWACVGSQSALGTSAFTGAGGRLSTSRQRAVGYSCTASACSHKCWVLGLQTAMMGGHQ